MRVLVADDEGGVSGLAPEVRLGNGGDNAFQKPAAILEQGRAQRALRPIQIQGGARLAALPQQGQELVGFAEPLILDAFEGPGFFFESSRACCRVWTMVRSANSAAKAWKR